MPENPPASPVSGRQSDAELADLEKARSERQVDKLTALFESNGEPEEPEWDDAAVFGGGESASEARLEQQMAPLAHANLKERMRTESDRQARARAKR